MAKSSVAVIVLNWNDAALLPQSTGSLQNQSLPCDIIVVDNGSADNSSAVIESFGSAVTALWNKKNLGFAGGVNTGIRYALEAGYEYIGLLNNDAVADKDWAKQLVGVLKKDPSLGATTCALVDPKGKHYDSTGDFYTNWGLPYPRGRGEPVNGQFDKTTSVTAVSGGGSMFKAAFFNDVGLFDEDFFAYYEDVDLGLRGQLRGWYFRFASKAVAYHATGSTSSRVKGFNTYQTFKNLPWVIIKNVPLRVLPSIVIRFKLAWIGFLVSAVQRRQLRYALRGIAVSLLLLPKKLFERLRIQRERTISSQQFSDLLIHDLPPNAAKLRKLRAAYWKLRGRA